MAGIYLHIPFCKQACHYCNFHFSTNLSKKSALVEALVKEIELKRGLSEFEGIETIYFGGGTPSLLTHQELKFIFDALRRNFDCHEVQEITIEANPDDIEKELALSWKSLGINRVSLGVQSFRDSDLKQMNRAHRANQSIESIKILQESGFNNISIDLIYGIPGLSNVDWTRNIQQAISLGIPHVSSYCLTVEEGTALHHFIRKKNWPDTDDEISAQQFQLLIENLAEAGLEQYEISNFAKPGFESKHNSSYWQGKIYLGFGPGAHEYHSGKRFWNISSNSGYIQAIESGRIPCQSEDLGEKDVLNEYIMTSLRTREGLSLKRHLELRGIQTEAFKSKLKAWESEGKLIQNGDRIQLTATGRFFADGIASDLFELD